MRRFSLLLVGLALAYGTVWAAGPQAKVLIVDLTQTVMESMQLEVLARALLATGNFQLAAVTEPPNGPHPRGPFQFVVIVPERGAGGGMYPHPAGETAPGLQAALQGLEEAVRLVFRGERRPVDPGVDLYPALWSAYFLKVGILEGIGG